MGTLTKLHVPLLIPPPPLSFISPPPLIPPPLLIPPSPPSTGLNTGIVLWFQQFYAMFLKRLYNSFRFWVALIWQFVLPLSFVLWAMILAKTLPGFNSDEPPRDLTINLSSISNNRTFFYAKFGNDDIDVSVVDNYMYLPKTESNILSNISQIVN